MRLLNVSTYLLEEFFEPRIPPYVILSHRWEEDEVLFNVIATKHKKGLRKLETVFSSTSDYKQQKGFKKIQLVCQAALKADITYVWIDTCCIDKSSSSELSEAINSMFAWYRKSSFCYAYLSDIEFVSGKEDITQSVWFDRGWTLQELIAPNMVVFYDEDGRRVGTRDSLSTQISRKTRIPEKVLSGMADSNRMSQDYTAAQKMSWAAGRLTTRLEDRAYSLIGIFDVSMPLLYGEGARAFLRLQEEIIRTGTDLSILSWSSLGDEVGNRRTDLLAQSPDDFYDCEDIVKSFAAPGTSATDTSFVMTNQGLRIKRPPVVILPSTDNDPQVALSLNCRKSSDVSGVLALKVQVTGSVTTVKTPAGTEKKVCHVGWLSKATALDPRLVRVVFFEPVVLSTWSTVTISKRRTGMEGQHSNIPKYPHKYLWLQPPANDTWATWQALSYLPARDWDPNTMTFCLESRDYGYWNFAAIAFGSDLGEGFFVHVKCSAKANMVLSVLSECDFRSSLQGTGDFYYLANPRTPDNTEYRSEVTTLDISSNCRVKVLPNHLSRYGETILQLQIQIERPPRKAEESPIEVAANPDISTYLPPMNYSSTSGYIRTNKLNRPNEPVAQFISALHTPRTIEWTPQELDSTEIDSSKCVLNLQDAYTLYGWRTPQCIRDYVKTVSTSRHVDKRKGLFHGYVGGRRQQQDRALAEPAELADTSKMTTVLADDLSINNLEELPFYPSDGVSVSDVEENSA